MAVDRDTRLFIDATCLYAAAHSPSGGSARVLRLGTLRWFVCWVSQTVLLEAERAVYRKGSTAALTAFQGLLQHVPWRYAPVPIDPVARYPDVNRKDAHVYGAARASSARYLLTPDKRLAAEINALVGTPLALPPDDFLQQELPTHPDYPEEPAAGRQQDTDEPGR
jgi:hypothetical protein